MPLANTLTYLSFALQDELFAIPVQYVLEVLQKRKITKVPNSPGHVVGVINFRGEIIPLFETRSKFNLTPRSYNEKFVIVVLQVGDGESAMVMGIITDSVKDVITIEEIKVMPVPQMNSKFNVEFLNGVAKIEEQFIMLLDTEKVFAGYSELVY